MAHRVLGIDIGATEIKAVLADVSWREAQVLGLYVECVPSAQDMAHRPPLQAPDFPPAAAEPPIAGEAAAPPPPAPHEPAPPWVYALADLLKKHNIEYHEIHLSLPGAVATTHLLTLPFENRRRLEQVLPFELENIVPFDLEKMHVAFEVLGKAPEGGFRVLVCLTAKETMRRFLSHLALAGVDPKVVDFAPHALFGAMRLTLPDEMSPCAVVDFGHTHTDVVVLRAGSLQQLRSIPVGGAALDQSLAKALRIDAARAAELKIKQGSLASPDAVGEALRRGLESLLIRLRQTLQGAHAEGVEVTRLYLTGRGSLLPGLADVLAEDLGVEVLMLKPLPAGLPVSADANDPETQARSAYPLALTQRGQGVLRALDLNLRGGEFFYHRQRIAMQASIRGIVAAAAVILILLGYNIVSSHLQKKAYYEALLNQEEQVYLKAFPGAKPAQPLDQFRAQVGKTLAKYRTVGFFGEGDLRAVDILKALSGVIPPDITVDFKKVDIAMDSVKIEGECLAFPDVDKIEDALKKIPGFKNVKKESSKSVAEKVKFKFVIHFEETAKPATSGGRPAKPTPTLATSPRKPT
jgi:type IV pilus assembly protein PilM